MEDKPKSHTPVLDQGPGAPSRTYNALEGFRFSGDFEHTPVVSVRRRFRSNAGPLPGDVSMIVQNAVHDEDSGTARVLKRTTAKHKVVSSGYRKWL
jgi:hypothetical protein